jgi:glycosyltransferase involved in cell wall biosynthesis
MKELSIIIPAYNEGERIAKTLGDYIRFFEDKYQKDFEILVILNGCKDNTLKVVQRYSKKYPQIKYKDIKEAIGKGGAIIEGFKIAEGDLIGFVDADNATKPAEFYELIKNKDERYDAIIASRWLKESKIPVKQPRLRIFLGRCYNFLIRLLFRLRLKDTQCGAKYFQKNL